MIDITPQNQPEDEPPISTICNIRLYSEPVNLQCYLHNACNMQEIIPGLFLGPYSSADRHCLANLLQNNIRYIICVRQELEASYIRPQSNDPNFTYLTLEINDMATENIIRFFPKVKQFIDEVISKNCKVLVHGNRGNSRSATLVMAYIMEKYGITSEEAFAFVKTKRGSISPNEGFVAQLIEYEPIYKARQSFSHGEPSSDNSRQKRKCEELSESIDVDLIQPPPSPSSDQNYHLTRQNVQDFSNNLYRLLLKH